ncbi:hypothetical protein SAR11G3_01342 [Candidatus Pelagibacter sp. IMCC9063]|nr:hypothetical protein SAR11G3_01342 [Candidatus Pelagibacter sp. IMCC9063]
MKQLIMRLFFLTSTKINSNSSKVSDTLDCANYIKIKNR